MCFMTFIDRLFRPPRPVKRVTSSGTEVLNESLRFEAGIWHSPTVIDKCGQATKGVWWMPWHREAMKDVVACDKLREAGKRALIRRFLNAETRLGSIPVIQR